MLHFQWSELVWKHIGGSCEHFLRLGHQISLSSDSICSLDYLEASISSLQHVEDEIFRVKLIQFDKVHVLEG